MPPKSTRTKLTDDVDINVLRIISMEFNRSYGNLIGFGYKHSAGMQAKYDIQFTRVLFE